MRRERFANDAQSTLAAGISDTDTTLTVADGSTYPSEGDFRLRIDDELLLATARSGNMLTVTRAIEGTTAASHSAGAVAPQILTLDGIRQYGRDNVPGFDGSRPPLRIMDSSGNTLTSADFSIVNQSSAAISDVDGAILLRRPSTSGQSFTLLARSQPTPPATLTIAMRCCWPSAVASARVMGAIGLRESATGKLLLCSLERTSSGGVGFSVFGYSNPTAEGPTRLNPQVSLALMPEIWLQLSDNGTNVTFSASDDGQSWVALYSQPRTDDFTTAPDQWVWGMSANSTSRDCTSRLVHWSE